MNDWLVWLTAIFQILGSASLVVSMLILYRELRENNRLARAANVQAQVGLSAPFYMALAQDRQLAELFARGVRGGGLDEVDRLRYQNLLIGWLTFYENIFYQRQKKLLDRGAFEPWRRDLEMFLRRQHVPAHWDGIKGLFQRQFVAEVEAILAAREGAD